MSDWIRVSRQQRCPICDHSDWCLLAADGSACICPRVESPKRCGEAGWLHVLGQSLGWAPRPRRIVLNDGHVPSAGIEKMARSFMTHDFDRMLALAKSLGLSIESLLRFGVGYDTVQNCSTWPMRDASGRILGINRRFPDGSKRIYPGHRAGIYMPTCLLSDLSGLTLLVAEGGSDALAGLELGFQTVGRFSCTHGTGLLVKLVRRRRPAEVVIVADADGPGQRGAEALAVALLPYVARLKLIKPPEPHKDMRTWRQAGATVEDLHRRIATSPLKKLKVGVIHDSK